MKFPRRSITGSLALLALLGTTASAQSVHVVDASGSTGTFTTITSAILAASDGDLILVKPGSYGFPFIDDISLTIVADKSTSTADVLTSRILINNLASSRAVNLAGLDLVVSAPYFGPGFWTTSCAGPIQIRDCSAIVSGPGQGILATNSDAVSVVDTTLDATMAGMGYAGTDEAHAISSEDSNVFIFGCLLESGEGRSGDFLDGTAGKRGPAGLRLTGGLGLAVRSTVTGGIGGRGGYNGFTCGDGGDGGPGIELFQGSASPELVRSNLSLAGGAGGLANAFIPQPPTCFDGQPGIQQQVNSGVITTDDHDARALETEYLVRFNEVKTERFIGKQGDLVFHIFGAFPGNPALIPELTGISAVGTPNFVRYRGLIPASGEKVLPIVVPPLGFDFAVIYEQAAFYDGFRFYLSNPQFSVILNDAF